MRNTVEDIRQLMLLIIVCYFYKMPLECCFSTLNLKLKIIKKYTYTHTANSDNLGSNKEAGGEAQGAQGSSKICTSREIVSPLSRLIRRFRNKYH